MSIKSLNKKYGKNKTLVTEGFDFKVPDSDVVFKLRQFNSVENAELAKQAVAEDLKPYARQLQNDSIPAKKSHEINVRMWCKIALVGWSNLVDDEGNQIPFSLDKAVEIMLEYEDLYLELVNQSKDTSNFALDLGND